EGCTDKLTLFRMLKVLAFPLRGRRRLEEKLRNYNSKQIFGLHSGKEVKDFLAQQKRFADDMMSSSTTDFDAKTAGAPEPYGSGAPAALLPLSSRIRSAIAGRQFR